MIIIVLVTPQWGCVRVCTEIIQKYKINVLHHSIL